MQSLRAIVECHRSIGLIQADTFRIGEQKASQSDWRIIDRTNVRGTFNDDQMALKNRDTLPGRLLGEPRANLRVGQVEARSTELGSAPMIAVRGRLPR